MGGWILLLLNFTVVSIGFFMDFKTFLVHNSKFQALFVCPSLASLLSFLLFLVIMQQLMFKLFPFH